MNIVFLYPGQGAQYVGMGRDFYDYSPTVRELFEMGSDAGKLDLAALLFSGTEDHLRQTDNTQIAVTLVNLAARQVLADFGITSTACAGFSLGEYTALVDAGILSREDVLTLVLQRGQIMERASRHLDRSSGGSAGMMAVMGKDLPEVRQILADAGIDDVYPSLHNSPIQTVVGGTADRLEAAAAAFKAAGVRKAIPLKVSGPFHTPLMEEAREDLGRIVQWVTFRDPERPVYSNVTAERITSGAEARKRCLEQLVNPVLWVDEQRRILAEDADLVIEAGPGSVLQGLWSAMGRTDENWPVDRCRTAGTLEQIEAIARDVEQEQSHAS